MGEYHHGDLANALLDSAREVLNDKGIHGLSLRACAANAGVSHSAPSHHFKSLSGLLTELAIIAFDEFEIALRTKYEQGSGQQSIDRLQAVGQAYVDFAVKEPQLFQLMFSSAPLDFENDRLQQSADKARQQLKNIVNLLFDEKGLEEHKRDQVELLIWSIVHGYSKLLINDKSKQGECSNDSAATLPDVKLLGKLLNFS